MFWILLGVSIFIWGAYYGIRSLYAEYTTPAGINRFANRYLRTSVWVEIFFRCASQILVLAISIMAILGKIEKLPGLIFIQGAFTVVMAFREAIFVGDHLKSTEDTRRRVEGKYDVKWDPKKNTAEISEHWEGMDSIPWQSILAFPFRLVHNFCIPIAVLVFEYALRKKYDKNQKAYYKKRFEK